MLRLEIACYFAPSRLALDAHCSPKKTQFITFRGIEKVKSPQGLLDLNSAGKEELISINGIGPVLSAKIIAGRLYKTVDDLLKVKGIGPKKHKIFRPYFVVR